MFFKTQKSVLKTYKVLKKTSEGKEKKSAGFKTRSVLKLFHPFFEKKSLKKSPQKIGGGRPSVEGQKFLNFWRPPQGTKDPLGGHKNINFFDPPLRSWFFDDRARSRSSKKNGCSNHIFSKEKKYRRNNHFFLVGLTSNQKTPIHRISKKKVIDFFFGALFLIEKAEKIEQVVDFFDQKYQEIQDFLDFW